MTVAAHPSDRLLAGEDRQLAAKAFESLPSRWRAALWLVEVEGMSPAEAAPLLRLSTDEVSVIVAEAGTELQERCAQLAPRDPGQDCVFTRAKLPAFVADGLSTPEANRVRGHLAECADCHSRLGEAEQTGRPTRRSLAAPTRSVAVRRSGPWRRRPRAAWAAVVVVVALIGVGLVVAGAWSSSAPSRSLPLAEPRRAPLSSGAVTAAADVTTTVPEPPAVPAAAESALGRHLVRGQRSSVAQAKGSSLGIFDAPNAPAPAQTLANPRPSSAPLVLFVLDEQPGWLHVLLPVRPNGSNGWVHSAEVTVVTYDLAVVVELGAHRITAYRGNDVILSEPIGVGTSEAPTPGGLYFITELFQPIDGPGGPYGPYAFGLSGHSDVLYDFGGGDGQFGIHGTNDPSGLGRDVSHGCIRMSNAGITQLARTLPLGIPVEIQA